MMRTESEAALAQLKQAAGANRRIVFVSGNFNVVHPGHLRLLKFAADCGDYLVVGVNAHSGGETPVSEPLRLENVRGIGVVDFAFLLFDRAEDFIAALRPAVVVKGKEHESRPNPEKAAIESYGGQLLFSSGEVVFSSLDLLRSEFSELNLSTISKPLEFPRRHGFELAGLKGVLAKFSDLKVVVVGDVIVDEYVACDALGMSQEDPTIVVAPVLTQRFLGGAGIVAAHAKGLGASVQLVSISGRDATADFAKSKLDEFGVDSVLLADDSRPTTLKQRFRAGQRTLLRVSHLKQHIADAELQRAMLKAIRDRLDGADLLIMSDFNYGCLPQPLVEAIGEDCRKRGVPIVADSQSSSQVGDISRFKDALLLTPTEREARLAVRDFSSGLVVLADALHDRTRAKHVILKLGSEGLLVHTERSGAAQVVTDQLPAFNRAPKDVAGAGDSLLVAASMALVAGASIWKAAYLGALAAACQVGRIGNTPVTRADVEAELAA